MSYTSTLDHFSNDITNFTRGSHTPTPSVQPDAAVASPGQSSHTPTPSVQPDAAVADSADSFDPALHHPDPFVRFWARVMGHCRAHYQDEGGMSTIEYALGCIAAAALGGLLYVVVTSGAVEQALSGIFERALSEGPQR